MQSTGSLTTAEEVARQRARAQRQRNKPAIRQKMDEVIGLLQQMVPHGTIEKSLADKWKCKRKFVRLIMSYVYAEWAEQADEMMPFRRDQLRQTFQILYMKCIADKDHKTASFILRELGQLDGAYAPKEVQLSGQVGIGLGLAQLGFQSSEEVKARISELQNRIKAGGGMVIGKNNPGNGVTPNQVMQIIDATSSEAPEGDGK